MTIDDTCSCNRYRSAYESYRMSEFLPAQVPRCLAVVSHDFRILSHCPGVQWEGEIAGDGEVMNVDVWFQSSVTLQRWIFVDIPTVSFHMLLHYSSMSRNLSIPSSSRLWMLFIFIADS